MSSHRHNPDATSARDTYLDAARACILDVGWRRTTLTEVARRAGVSRMTIYRTWSDMRELLADLMTREWAGLVTTTGAEYDAAGPPTLDRIATELLELVAALRQNELFVRIVELDPELILPYLLSRRGRSQQLIADLIADQLRAAQAAGTVRPGDPLTMARTLLLAGHGFVLSAHTMVDEQVDLEALDAQMRALIAVGLAPESDR